MNFGDLIAKGSAVFLKKKLSAMQAVFDAGTAPEKAAFQSSVSGYVKAVPLSTASNTISKCWVGVEF